MNEDNTETQGKTTNPMTNEPKTEQRLERIVTGLPKHGTQWARAQHPTTERA